jgi:glutamyl endopeptidase
VANRTRNRAAKARGIAQLYRQELSTEQVAFAAPAAEVPGERPALEAGAAPDLHTPVASGAQVAGILGAEDPEFGRAGAPESANDLEREAVAGPSAEGMELAAAGADEGEEGDEELLLDAWYAEFSDPGTRALMRHQPPDESFLEVVIGADDRVQVNITDSYPWRSIASLLITANDGSRWIGTAWFVGPRTLITAGHCVYIHSRGGWAREIEVVPGRNAALRPFSSCKATDLRSVIGWTQNQLQDYDYGAIILPEDQRKGDEVGWLGFVNYSDANLNNRIANLSGYPGDKPSGTQWFHARRLRSVTSTRLVYDIDTAGGQSGAPVWFLQNGQRYGVGIHTNGSVTGNAATRISDSVFQNLTGWKADGA